MTAKVENHDNLVKKETGLVSVTDSNAYTKAMKRRADKAKLKTMEDRITKLEAIIEGLTNG